MSLPAPNTKMELAHSRSSEEQDRYAKLVDMVLEPRHGEVSVPRIARTMFLVGKLMNEIPEPDALDISCLADDAARRDSEPLQLAYLEAYLRKSKGWPASFAGMFPCERCCKATDNLCQCGNEARSICYTCMELKLRCIDCPN